MYSPRKRTSAFMERKSNQMCCQPVNADVVLKGVAGDDEYGCPPRSNGNAPFEHISFRELAARGTSKMDMTAVTCCEENNIPG